MGKINSVNQNLQRKISDFAQSPKVSAKNPNFRGIPPEVSKLTNVQQNAIKKTLKGSYLGLMGKAFNNLSETAGEIQNLCVMNFGTVFVAPLVIAFNPLSKDDKNTKKYTAWRQPVSGLIALGMGLGLNIPVQRYVDKLVSEGKLSKFDLQSAPPDNYLKGKYNRIIKHFDKMSESEKKYFDMINTDKSIKTADHFKEKYGIYTDFIEDVHKVTTEKAAKVFLDPKNKKGLLNMSLGDFLVDNFKFDRNYLDNSLLNPDSTKRHLENVKIMDFLRSIGYSKAEASESKVRAFFINQMGCDKKAARAVEAFVSHESIDKETLTLKQFFKAFGMDEGFASNKEMLNMKMDKFLGWMHEKAKFHKTAAKEFPEFLKTHAEEMVKNLAHDASRNYGAFKKVQGIALSLATLPLSCGALNWAYPRFMETCFPHLTKPSTDKGGK